MDNLDLLKYTIRGLNYRYNALKKINLLLGEATDLHKFLDGVLGILIELMDAEIGIIILDDKGDQRIEILRGNLLLKKETELKEKIEGLLLPKDLLYITELKQHEKEIQINQKYDPGIEHHEIIEKDTGKINNIVSVPINLKKNVVGIIELFNVRVELNDEKKDTLISIGGNIGVPTGLIKRINIMQERTTALKQLAVITKAINSPHQINMVLNTVIKNAQKFFEADGCSILLNDEDHKLEFVAVTGEKADILKGQKLDKGEGIAGWVIENDQSIIIEDVAADNRFSPRIDSATEMNTGSVICTPLKVLNEVKGVIEIIRMKERYPFNEEDLGMLSILASHASIAIEKSKVFSQRDAWFKSIIELLCGLIAVKDELFPEHRKTVKKYVILLGRRLDLSSEDIEYLDLAASIQDISKLIIPEKILKKEKELSADEWNEIRKHPDLSVQILDTVAEFKDIVPIIKYHHEKWDGSGYPEGLSGNEIPRLARILAVADAYVAMTNKRPYRDNLSPDKAKEELLKLSGMQFDPEIVDEFIKILEKDESGISSDQTPLE